MSLSAIEGVQITKQFNKQNILNDLNFRVPKHSITLVNGKNGSGKSITLKIIAGLITQFDGSLLINGKISYAVDIFPNNLSLTINEYFEFLLKVHSNNQTKVKLNYLINHLKLSSFLNQKLKDCSKGTKQKVNVIQCLIKNADIYILDEPFSGLDQNATKFLINYLDWLKLSSTIILTSHELNQLINITTHILNIETGIFYINDINKNHLVATSKLIVVKNDSVTINLLKEIQNQKITYTDNNKISIQTNQSDLNLVLKQLIVHNCEILEIKDVKNF
ncbi:ATP-binding cassette domain-containing protein [Staphylococcus epidermidis]|uniref:ATP-binding cassette domain-containing protein n=1 Tax=Staphylococcus epidermidis TaxID=1282 RepID=UPI0018793BA1|nr:ATP-binding cassette domain-containing protein [Staphylococcus epidermidis]MBE7302257.1 ABC transporter ATP-binding protein [Staphylococcus epidermidis]MCG1160799.1 ATP-binding cassette domain-containing protein [Staphylococcus epidermidis]MCG1300133.1 ATP-binding cassette domain-containing protein [Staphylococcus epidermidis]MCG1437599.1 ATP-binding cassette domain-containing protein [Staphylococcus epidermidis]MCG1751368.1 ATP-binding cassette domain-containing protein [Staphylococcus epi